MLVLTRRLGEAIHIGDGVLVTVVELDGRSVKLGITAPRSVPVYREEVYRRIQEENVRAASIGDADLGSIAGLLRKDDGVTRDEAGLNAGTPPEG